jgi:hypothetical protein
MEDEIMVFEWSSSLALGLILCDHVASMRSNLLSSFYSHCPFPNASHP